jgi:hypothetical protein
MIKNYDDEEKYFGRSCLRPCAQQPCSEGKATTTFLSQDKVKVTADWYKIDDTSRVIILCHQEESSRGEYIQTAKRFNKL